MLDNVNELQWQGTKNSYNINNLKDAAKSQQHILLSNYFFKNVNFVFFTYLLTYTQVILAFSRQTFISQVTVSFCQYLLQIIDCCARKSSIKSN